MTYSPKTLTDLGRYWTGQGGVNLGVVGDVNHLTGYHLGRDRIYSSTGQGDDDYSVRHPRDKAGLSGAASAIDLGKLEGSYHKLYAFSRWLVSQGQSGAPGTGDIREIIYSPDGQQVQRWSGIDNKIHTGPGNGDSSHRTHTHISYFRDSEQRDKVTTFAAYWNGEDDMGLEGGPVSPGEGIGTVRIKAGRGLVNLRTGKATVPANAERSSFGRWRLAEPLGEGAARQLGYLVSLGAEGHIALDDVVESFTPATPEVPPPVTAPSVLTGDDGSVYRKE